MPYIWQMMWLGGIVVSDQEIMGSTPGHCIIR